MTDITTDGAHLAGVLATVREPPAMATRPERRHIRPPGIVLHHSGGRPSATVAEIREEHQRERGWADVGYHWIVREFAPGEWRAEPGRPEEYVGAHAPGRNDWLGVVVLGTYEPPAPPPPAAAVVALVACLADLCSRYDLAPDRIRPHRESGCLGPGGTRGTTDCPGQHLVDLLPQIRADVAAQLEAA